MDGSARQEDFLFAEHVLRRGFATEEQVQECLRLVEKLHGEMGLADSLENILLKKGYIAKAQASVIRGDINPEVGRSKNQIEGYQLLTRLGSGAMGSVYKAHHMKLNIPVALKVLRVDLAKSRTQVERLKREAQLAARLNHPNIVRSLDVGESNGFNYFAMEFVDGLTVRQMLRKGRLKEKDALRITRDIARALEHAHSQGVVHRDIKPANIILTKNGVVKLADFGLARGQEPSDLTLDQASIGTPQYLAPEQARRAADATIKSDLFSLGASLYHMVTGRPPFSGGNLGEIFQKVLASEFDPPEAVVPDLSLDTVYLIHRLMRGNPRERYATPADLLADLERLERGERIAPADFKGDYAVYIRRRRRKRALLGAGAIGVVVAATVLTIDMIRESAAQAERVERCRTADAVGEKDDARTLPELRELLGRLQRARPADCSDAEVAELTLRTRRVAADLGHLEKAEGALDTARSKGAEFRKLHRMVGQLTRQMSLSGLWLRAEKIQSEIEKLSNAAAEAHYERVFRFSIHKDAEEALKELTALDTALHERYLQTPRAGEVSGQPQALRNLIDDWSEADEIYTKIIGNYSGKHRYVDAHSERKKFMEARREALKRARRAGLDDRAIREFFPEKDPFEQALRQDERAYFENTLRASINQLLAKHDTKAAEKLILAFEPHAFATVREVNYQKARIERIGTELESAQNNEIDALKKTFHRALRERRWRYAWEAVQAAFARTDWTPESRDKLRPLHDRARIYDALFRRYQQNLGYKAIADYTTDELLEQLRFDSSKADDVRLRAYFFVGESFVAEDPRTERAMLKRALSDMVDDTYAETLAEREVRVAAEANQGEIAAEKYGREYKEAVDRQDPVQALQSIVVLLTRYRWTAYVAQRRSQLEKAKKDFEIRGRPKLTRLNAGIPPGNFYEDVEASPSRFRMIFDFKEWWPYSEQYAEPAKHRAELDVLAQKFWREHRKGKLEPGELERIKHQLAWFNKSDKLLVPAKKLGGARLQFDKRNTELWVAALKGKPKGPLGVITLENPFRADKDWSIEVSVAWDVARDGGPKANFELNENEFGEEVKRRTSWNLPHYFALTAGQFQVGILATGAGPSGHRYGGGSGAMLFKQVSLFEGFNERFKLFHGRTLEKKRRSKKPELAYIVLEEKPYRIRLERRGSDLVCTIAPHEQWVKQGRRFDARNTVLVHRYPKHVFDKDVDIEGVREFRILSLEPCRLISVVIEGEPQTAR